MNIIRERKTSRESRHFRSAAQNYALALARLNISCPKSFKDSSKRKTPSQRHHRERAADHEIVSERNGQAERRENYDLSHQSEEEPDKDVGDRLNQRHESRLSMSIFAQK